MSFLAIVGALVGPLVPVAIFSFLVEAANTFRDAPKSPPAAHPAMSAAELKALVRRHFKRPANFDPDDGMRKLAVLVGLEER